VLAACAGHGDVLWAADTRIEQDVQLRVRDSLCWSDDELRLLLADVAEEEYRGRGSRFQNVAVLILCGWDAARRRQLERPIIGAEQRIAWLALMILAHAEDRRALLIAERLVPRSRALHDDPTALELVDLLREHGWVSMW
jgi:hypothetical protein